MTAGEQVFLRIELEVLLKRLKRNLDQVGVEVLKSTYKKGYGELLREIREKAETYMKEAVFNGMGGYFRKNEVSSLFRELNSVVNEADDSTEEACLPVHNKMTRGRRSTLNSVTLRGMLLAADIINGERRGALGVETEKGQICRYYAEIVDSSGAGDEIRIFLYDPKKGSWRASVKKEKTMSLYPRIGENGASGKELFLLLAYASMILGPVYDGEFEGSFQTFVKEKAKGFPDMDLAMECAFLCCDNLYRRLENRDTLKEMGIPFHNDEIASGNVPLSRFKKGSYKLTREDFGAFQVLNVKGEIETLGTVGELKSRYNRNFSLTENEKQQVPSLPDHYQVPAEVSEIVEAVLYTPMRVFMSAGESGTGKTTNAKMVAQLLGMPYYFFTCGEGTDETDLVSTMIPNIGRKEARPAMELPTFEDMIMDPASALACVCGSYEEEISQEEAFQRVLSAMYQTGFQNGQGEKDYVMVESSIVTACRRPSVIDVATLLYRPIITLVACHRINRYNDMRTENGERRTENGERRTENGERRTENGKGSRTLIFRREAYPETFIKTMVIISRYEVEYNKGENIFNKQ